MKLMKREGGAIPLTVIVFAAALAGGIEARAYGGRTPEAPAPAAPPAAQAQAAMQAAQANVAEIARLRAAMNADRTVVDIQTRMTRLRAERVIERRDAGGSNSWAYSVGGFSSFFGLFSSQESYSASGSRSWRSATVDARILDLNPEEVAGFDARERNELRQAQESLGAYVVAHAAEIARVKTLAADAFRNLGRARRIAEASGGAIPAPRLSVEQVTALLSAATEIRFYGRQTALRCTTTSHPSYSTSESSSSRSNRSVSAGFAAPFAIGRWFDSTSRSESNWEQRTRFAYSESTCSPATTTRLEADAGPGVVAVDLGGLDEDVRAWARWAAAVAVTEAPVPPDPHFGNPYFARDRGAPLH